MDLAFPLHSRYLQRVAGLARQFVPLILSDGHHWIFSIMSHNSTRPLAVGLYSE